jgi:opacity protein-like surface antigen
MTRRTIALVLLLLGLGTTPAAHAREPMVWLVMEGARNTPTNDFHHIAATGHHWALTLEQSMDPTISFGAQIAQHGWKTNSTFNTALSQTLSVALDAGYDPLSQPPIVDASARYDVIEYTAHTKVSLPLERSPLTPYLQVGFGGYRVRTCAIVDGLEVADEHMTFVGVQLGGGVAMRITPHLRVGVHAIYHHIPTEDHLGINLSSTALGADMSIGLGR